MDDGPFPTNVPARLDRLRWSVKAERNDRAAAFREVHVWRLANGRATDFREFQGDEQAEDRFWS
jgi:hypothetical protein